MTISGFVEVIRFSYSGFLSTIDLQFRTSTFNDLLILFLFGFRDVLVLFCFGVDVTGWGNTGGEAVVGLVILESSGRWSYILDVSRDSRLAWDAVDIFMLSHVRHFQTPILESFPSRSYILSDIFWQSAWNHV